MSRRSSFAVAALGWLAFLVSLPMNAFGVRGAEEGYLALVGGWVYGLLAFNQPSGVFNFTTGELIFPAPRGLAERVQFSWWGVLWLTNIFILISPWWVFSPTTRNARILVRASILNATLIAYVFLDGLGIVAAGYYVWLGSFFLLSAALFGRARHTSPKRGAA